MKIGMSFKVDVTKLDKSRFFQGAKGTYVDLTAFIDTDQVGQYGDNGTISQSTTLEERKEGKKMPICGNVKVFYTDGHTRPKEPDLPMKKDDIPF